MQIVMLENQRREKAPFSLSGNALGTAFEKTGGKLCVRPEMAMEPEGLPNCGRPDPDDDNNWMEFYEHKRFGVGVADAWKPFRNFLSFIKENKITCESELIWIDQSNPIGPDNVIIARDRETADDVNAYLQKYEYINQSVGMSDEWLDVRKFISDLKAMGIKPEDSLSRHDMARPYGPDNVVVRSGSREKKWYTAYQGKRRRYGLAKEWSRYEDFIEAMKEMGLNESHEIRILRGDRPFGPDNYQLVGKGGKETETVEKQPEPAVPRETKEFQEVEPYPLCEKAQAFLDSHADDLVKICRVYLTDIFGDLDGFGRFEAFAEWTVLSGYQPGMEFRKTGTGAYAPDTCEWYFPA